MSRRRSSSVVEVVARFGFALIVFATAAVRGEVDGRCNAECRCDQATNSVNCSGADLNATSRVFFPARTRVLILDDNSIAELTSEFFDAVADVSGLEVLSAKNNGLRAVEESTFRRFAGLKEVWLDDNRLTSLPEKLFEQNGRLTLLNLANNSLSIEVLTPLLVHLPNLIALDVSRATMQNSSLPAAFSRLTNLQNFTFQGANIANMTGEFFLSLSELTNLDLSNSELNGVDPEAFAPLLRLEELSLARSVIKTHDVENILSGLQNSSLEVLNLNDLFTLDGRNHSVTSHLFGHPEHSKLKKLFFQGNYAGLHGKIHARLFQNLKNLHELHLDHCDVLSISPEAFKGLNHLRILHLTNNLLSCVRESQCHFLENNSSQLKSLHLLDLSDNLLSDSENAVRFTEVIFSQLIHLNLRRNKLRSVSPGMFGKLDKLFTLDLSENPIEDIASESFAGLTGLKKLHIENCPRLSRIHNGSFSGLASLRILSLKNSGILHIHHAAFVHLISLDELLLRNNRLGESPHDAVVRITLKKSGLRVLDLGGNKLTAIPSGLLQHGQKLRSLFLDHNYIYDCRALRSLFGSNLQSLDLSFNRFVQPTRDCFEGLTYLNNIDMAGNPFMCSCGVKTFTAWLKTKLSSENSHEYICVTPDYRGGLNMLKVSYSSWECQGQTALMTFVAVCVSLFIVCGLAFLFYRAYVRRRGILLRSRSSSAMEASPSQSQANVPSHRTSNGSTAAVNYCTRYSPLEEEEMKDNDKARIVPDDAPNRFNRADIEVHSERVNCSKSGEVKNGSEPRKTCRIEASTSSGGSSRASQTRASPTDASARLIDDDVDNDVMLFTSDHGGSKLEHYEEDSV